MEEIQAIMEKLMDLQKHSNESQSQSDEVLNMINNIVRKQNQTEVQLLKYICIKMELCKCSY